MYTLCEQVEEVACFPALLTNYNTSSFEGEVGSLQGIISQGEISQSTCQVAASAATGSTTQLHGRVGETGILIPVAQLELVHCREEEMMSAGSKTLWALPCHLPQGCLEGQQVAHHGSSLEVKSLFFTATDPATHCPNPNYSHKMETLLMVQILGKSRLLQV